MDIMLKIMLIASIILIGYNISELFASYKTSCKKKEEFKRMLAISDFKSGDIRRSNLILSFILSMAFVILTYLSGFAIWIVILIAIKMFFTLYCSDLTLVHVLRAGELNKKFYMLTKLDALFNIIFGLAIALILVY